MRWILWFAAVCTLPAQTLPWMDISGTWKMHESDDIAFAQPELDDFGWHAVSLPRENFLFGSYNYRQVWFWLRRTVELPEGVQRHHLALTIGKLTENYEVYVNGERVARVGNFDGRSSRIARPRTFELPALNVGKITIAIRCWRHNIGGAAIWRAAPDPGPWLITARQNAPRSAGENFITSLRVRRSPDLVLGVGLITVAIILLLIFAGQRHRTELLWLGLYCSLVAYNRVTQVLLIASETTPWGQTPLWSYLHGPVLTEFLLAALAVRSPATRWIVWITALFFTFNRSTFIPVSSIVSAGALICILVRSRKRGSEFYLIASGSAVIHWQTLRQNLFIAPYLAGRNVFFIGPYEVNVYAACTLIFALGMVLTLNRRLLRDSAEKERMASELEAARTVQSLMLPSAALASGAYDIQAVYNPAQEVGGDFYHVLDDNVLVVGDVSGKGLRAAMLVSLLLGVLRETREREPGAVLSVMNRALAGSSGGTFVTCCCVRLGPEGLLTVASAGHPAPWLDGVEAELAPGLPLGIAPEAIYEERTFLLQPDGQLALVSDGVVEAANGSRELFGFERAAAIATKPAAHIADQARAWGQNDDITVVTVRRAAA